ncbi:MAG TPA: glycosyltransferase family 2 protein [Thermomicrobiales bacterium]|jgi:glycosyltransferase involved in cell wall biosynthesis|nr:glycosyltransferase family 2 protein [Thermomicrobiales bacterium]
MANVAAKQDGRGRRLPEAVRIPGSLSLVLPAHNEQENIGIVVRQALEVLPRFTDEFEIIVVNDGSRDDTARIIDELAASHPQVRPIHHEVNRGYGGALVSGFAATTGDFVMFMDSDRQFDLNDLALLSPFVDHFDIVAGFRRERNDPLHRRINAEVFNTVVRALYGVHMRDIDCAFKVFRGDLLRSISLTSSGALINTEMQAKLRRKGATLQQVAVHHYPRVAGEATGANLRVIGRAMRETLTLWWSMHRYRSRDEIRRRPTAIATDTVGAVGHLGARTVGHLAHRKPAEPAEGE